MEVESVLYGLLAASVGIALTLVCVHSLCRFLERTRPGLQLGGPIYAALAIRVIAALAVAITPYSRSLRGGDEVYWLGLAWDAANTPLFSTGSFELLTHEFHAWNFSLLTRILGAQPDPALRIVQIGLAVAGIAMIAAAVSDLAGPRGGMLTAWLLAFEPSNIFFSSILHKEPMLILAAGLIALGSVRVWQRTSLIGFAPILLGCLIAFATREYVGGFFVAAGLLIAFHGSLRHAAKYAPAIPIAALLVAVIVAVAPVVWSASDENALPADLQASQLANANDKDASLALEQVDFSSRWSILTNLPIRVRDVLLRPYVWQTENFSQQLGAIGGCIALVTIFFFLRFIWLSRGHIMARAAPFIYLTAGTLIAYSLSAGNAGTAFRYRTHILLFMIATAVVLRECVLDERKSRGTQRSEPDTQGASDDLSGHTAPMPI